jgi:Eukaryotic-type carbonic anhydrase
LPIPTELAAISIFLEAYDDAHDWPILNKIICAWREAEEKNREACGLPSVVSDYPGCFHYNRQGTSTPPPPTTNTSGVDTNTTNSTMTTNTTDPNITNTTVTNTTNTTVIETNDTVIDSRQGLRRRDTTSTITSTETSSSTTSYKPAISAYDIIMENYYHMSSGNTSYQPKQIKIEEETYEPMDDFDWEAFIAQQYVGDEYHTQVEEERQRYYDDVSLSDQSSRHLMDYQHIPWFNYFPMVGVRTEYFFRYSGTQTMPPCYGKFLEAGDRKQTLHWRVMKDPIRVSRRQINEMHRLIKDRIAPKDSPVKSCKPDTGAAPDPEDPEHKIIAARPLQNNNVAHFAVFCDCQSWGSKCMSKNASFFCHFGCNSN